MLLSPSPQPPMGRCAACCLSPLGSVPRRVRFRLASLRRRWVFCPLGGTLSPAVPSCRAAGGRVCTRAPLPRGRRRWVCWRVPSPRVGPSRLPLRGPPGACGVPRPSARGSAVFGREAGRGFAGAVPALPSRARARETVVPPSLPLCHVLFSFLCTCVVYGLGFWGCVGAVTFPPLLSPPVHHVSPKKYLGQLLAVDHSARASMKNAASCEN